MKDEDSEPPAKSSRIEIVPPKVTQNNQSWNKSIGGLRKPALASLVKSKKTVDTKEVSSTSVSTSIASRSNDASIGNDSSKGSDTNKTNDASKVAPSATGLSLLASYSGSDSDSQ